MNKVPPFIPNSKDNLHCVNAVFRMIYKHFLDQNFTWKEIDKLTKAIPGKVNWTFIGETDLAKKGLKVKNIEPLDYQKLYDEGVDYFRKTLGEETSDYYINRSNIASIIKYIPDFIDHVDHDHHIDGVNKPEQGNQGEGNGPVLRGNGPDAEQITETEYRTMPPVHHAQSGDHLGEQFLAWGEVSEVVEQACDQ